MEHEQDQMDTELAAAIGKELSPVVAEFTATITRSPLEEIGKWFTDHVRVRRYVSDLRLLAKAHAATEAAGLRPEAVPIKTLLPLLEAAALEPGADEGAP